MGKTVLGLALAALVFIPLERLFSHRREQKIFRAQWFNDACHFLFTHVLQHAALVVSAVAWTAAFKLVGPFLVPSWTQAAIAAQPVWLQCLEIIVITDFFGYFSHRLAHETPWMWRFHAVHHSIREMDWLAAARLHPLDQVVTKPVGFAVLYACGFSKTVFGVSFAWLIFWAFFLHANVRIGFGPLLRVISTPEFHHWHHAADAPAQNKNYAGLFPIWDILFGTFYAPRKRMPDAYGASDRVPTGYLKQMLYPFRS
jgi:sterol desaturase/sphingolipid hydroxylase (fatty acid hydroxylase superfamily)